MKTWTQRLHGAEFRIMRLQEAPTPNAHGTVDTPEACNQYLREQLEKSIHFNPDVENFIVILLNTRRKPLGMSIISQGTLDTILVHPRETFRAAIVMNAAAVVIAHNHPSGDHSPSEADIKVTRDLIRAGQLLKIEVLDHLVLGQASDVNPKSFSSLRELGYFYA